MANKTLTAPKGFKVSAVKAGIKASGKLDLGLIIADSPCDVAATFTTNKVVAPSVVIDREKVRSGKAQAVFVNAGNANACTGKRGVRDVHNICRQIGQQLDIDPDQVLVCSTGIIGEYLPMPQLRTGLDHAIDQLSTSTQAGKNLAQAILTTDLVQKISSSKFKLGTKEVTISGIAKGSGMIAPNMATMLIFLTTDANISSAALQRCFSHVVSQTFNKVTVDNHMSTSDTAIILASGRAQNPRITKKNQAYEKFSRALHNLCDDLAQQLAADGEGANCTINIRVAGAATAQHARLALRAISDSPLVRCAFNGADPNWGRIVSAVGYSGAKFNLEKLTCKIAGTPVFRAGRPCKFNAAQLSRKMKAKKWSVEVNLGAGRFEDFCYTCDLSHDYVSINADYHT